MRADFTLSMAYQGIPVQTETPGPDLAQQQFKDDSDVNNIVARFIRTGVLDYAARNQAYYGNWDPVDYQAALNTVLEARRLFDELPGQLRERFGGDPAAFLAFVSDEKNRPEMAKLGLLTPDAASQAASPNPSPGPGEPPAPQPANPVS